MNTDGQNNRSILASGLRLLFWFVHPCLSVFIRGFIPFLCLVTAFEARIDAHPSFPVSSIVRIEADGRVTIQVRHDALAFALNDTPTNISDEPMRRLLAGPRSELQKALDDARDRFLAQFELSADGQR